MSLVSVPTPKPQPELAVYGLTELDLFTSYQRTTVVAAGGEDPPNYNPAFPPKYWIETDLEGEPLLKPKIYLMFDPAAGALKPMVIQNPGVFNLPGLKTYPVYVIEPTFTILFQPGMEPATVNPSSMCLESEVAAIAEAWEQWDGNCRYELADMNPWGYIYPDNEERRVWNIFFHGLPLNAGGFVQDMYSRGVGAPGYWHYPGEITGSFNPEWVSTQPDAAPDPTKPPVPVPARTLLDNEQFTIGMMAQWQISRTDL